MGTLVWLMLSACAPPEPLDLSTHSDPELSARASAPMLRPEWVKRVKDVPTIATAVSAFHAGHGLFAYAVTPTESHDGMLGVGFLTEEGTKTAHGGPITDAAVRVLGTSDSTFVWLVDLADGSLALEDVGGNRRSRGRLFAQDSISEVCITEGGWVYFIDQASPDVLRQQAFRDSAIARPPRDIDLPASLADSPDRTAMRGSMSSQCALYSDTGDSLHVLDAETAQLHVHEFVESRQAVMADLSTTQRWARAWRERRSAPTTALDVAVGEQLIAVLFGGRSPQRARLVDLYDPNSGYLGSVRLPMRTERIALAHQRLYALARDTERSFLVSFVMPARYRGSGRDSIPVHQGRVPDSLLSSSKPSR